MRGQLLNLNTKLRGSSLINPKRTVNKERERTKTKKVTEKRKMENTTMILKVLKGIKYENKSSKCEQERKQKRVCKSKKKPLEQALHEAQRD